MDRRRRVLVTVLVCIVAAGTVFAIWRGGDGADSPPIPPDSPGTTEALTSDTNRVGDTSLPDSEESQPDPASDDGISAEGPASEVDDDSGDNTPTETLPDAADPEAGQSQHIPVPLGHAIQVGSWDIGVSQANLDATEVITGFVDFNEAPPDGHRFVLIELSGVYQGSGLVDPVFAWRLVDEEGEAIEATEGCGVIPNSVYDLTGVGGGSQFVANICFEATEGDLDRRIFLTLGLVTEDGRPYYFALD